MLTDTHMNSAQRKLKKQFPTLDGCQPISLGQRKVFRIIYYQGFQIVHCGRLNHWIVISKGFNGAGGKVQIYDSSFESLSKNMTPAVEIGVAQCFRDEQAESVAFEYVPMQQQTGGIDCGLFAAAVATGLVYGRDPATTHFDQEKLREHFIQCEKKGKLTVFPEKEGDCNMRCAAISGVIPLLGCCRNPESFGEIIRCRECGNKSHRSCVGMASASESECREWRCVHCIEE